MHERRGPWLISGTLLIISALAAGWAVYRHWLPCRGAMLNGSVVRGYRYDVEFTDGCLRRMDSGIVFPFPAEPAERDLLAAELGVAAMVLAALAWLVPVLWSRWRPRTKLVGCLPALLTLGLVANAALAIGRPERIADTSLPLGSWALVEVSAAAALIAITAWEQEIRGAALARLLVVAWGTTAFGGVHMIVEYAWMTTFSDANWDVPPGTGYATTAVLGLAGLAGLVLTARRADGLQRDVGVVAALAGVGSTDRGRQG